jgi:hypothetical protein
LPSSSSSPTPRFRRRLGENARADVAERFAWPTVTQATVEAYRSALGLEDRARARPARGGRVIALRKAPSSYDERFMGHDGERVPLERTPWTELRLEAVRDLVDPQPGDRILDSAALPARSRTTSRRSALTPSASTSRSSRSRRRVGSFPECTFEVADATSLPFGHESFDKAVAADFVEHIGDDVLPRDVRGAASRARPGRDVRGSTRRTRAT